MPGDTTGAAARPGGWRPLRKPDWLRIRLTGTEGYVAVERTLRGRGLHTVCEEARCPNIHECWGERRTATFMVLGDTCTRHCRFCAVRTGLPTLPDPQEPARVADAVAAMDLRYVVVTMVARDDLPDGGAAVLAETVRAIRARRPECVVEVLPSDLAGRRESLETLLAAAPDVLCHNVETVRRLTPAVRSRSDYDRSLAFLAAARALRPDLVTKSSLMVGLGETRAEVLETLADLRARAVDVLTIGQYLQPTANHLVVRRFVPPAEFESLRAEALARGFAWCEAGPLVRSSYHADDQFAAAVAALRATRAAATAAVPEA